jgi:hypothetical protein
MVCLVWETRWYIIYSFLTFFLFGLWNGIGWCIVTSFSHKLIISISMRNGVIPPNLRNELRIHHLICNGVAPQTKHPKVTPKSASPWLIVVIIKKYPESALNVQMHDACIVMTRSWYGHFYNHREHHMHCNFNLENCICIKLYFLGFAVFPRTIWCTPRVSIRASTQT